MKTYMDYHVLPTCCMLSCRLIERASSHIWTVCYPILFNCWPLDAHIRIASGLYVFLTMLLNLEVRFLVDKYTINIISPYNGSPITRYSQYFKGYLNSIPLVVLLE